MWIEEKIPIFLINHERFQSCWILSVISGWDTLKLLFCCINGVLTTDRKSVLVPVTYWKFSLWNCILCCQCLLRWREVRHAHVWKRAYTSAWATPPPCNTTIIIASIGHQSHFSLWKITFKQTRPEQPWCLNYIRSLFFKRFYILNWKHPTWWRPTWQRASFA